MKKHIYFFIIEHVNAIAGRARESVTYLSQTPTAQGDLRVSTEAVIALTRSIMQKGQMNNILSHPLNFDRIP